MSRVEFMQRLEQLLSDIPEYDRQDAIAYYNDYFDEAGTENEERVIQELGSPEKVAANLKADSGTDDSQKTESADNVVQNPQQTEKSSAKPKKDIPKALIIILAIFASPILLSVGLGLLGGLFGLACGLAAVVFAAGVSGISLLAAGMVCIANGIIRLFVSRPEGLFVIAVGCVVMAVSLLFIVLFMWMAFRWLPGAARGISGWCRKLFHRAERRSEV